MVFVVIVQDLVTCYINNVIITSGHNLNLGNVQGATQTSLDFHIHGMTLGSKHVKLYYMKRCQLCSTNDIIDQMTLIHPSIHLSIVNRLSKVGSQGQQLQQRAPDFPFPDHVSSLTGESPGAPKPEKRYNPSTWSWVYP